LVQNTKTGRTIKLPRAIPNVHKIYVTKTVKWTKRLQNIPTSFIARPSKIWIFGLKTNHLATLFDTCSGGVT
jgi:hypothetical protein